jgi:hypothetical protein
MNTVALATVGNRDPLAVSAQNAVLRDMTTCGLIEMYLGQIYETTQGHIPERRNYVQT